MLSVLLHLSTLARSVHHPAIKEMGLVKMGKLHWAPVAICIAVGGSSSAWAQTGSDCSYGMFPMRPFPQRIVQIGVGYHFGDPNNTIIGSVMGRCEPSGDIVFVCGVGARRNRSGYIDREKIFFGVYTPNTSPPNFHVHSTDQKAQAECERLVFRKPEKIR